MLFDKEIYTLLIAWLDKRISERATRSNECEQVNQMTEFDPHNQRNECIKLEIKFYIRSRITFCSRIKLQTNNFLFFFASEVQVISWRQRNELNEITRLNL